jgi:hypothetical protein
MSQIRLSDDYVNSSANTTGQFSSVMVAEVPDNEKYLIHDQALANIKLRDSEGNDISANSELYFGVMLPADDHPRKIDKKSYLAFNTLSLEKQYDDENNSECRLEIDKGGVLLLEQHKFVIQVKSEDTVNIAQSTIEINNVSKGRM